MRTLTCLIFILTNSVIAQADFQPVDNGTIQMETQKWIATHAGQTEIDGLPVIAALEEVHAGMQIPDMVALHGETMVPSLLPVVQQSYRLTLTASHHPLIRASYEVNPTTISMEGDFRMAFVSSSADQRGFQFVATAENDGTIRVMYTRKVFGSGEPTHGEFQLSPVPHIF